MAGNLVQYSKHPRPGDGSKSLFVIDVNPVAPTLADSFASEAVYELKVDTN